MAFDLERYLQNSRKLDISDLDLWRAKEHSLTFDEIRCLTYMMDIESHTIFYFRALLSTCAVRDPEVTAFLSCWAYEEFFHGRALRQFLESAGVHFDRARTAVVRSRRTWRERAEELAASGLCRIVSDYQAVYFVWGAIQELSTLEGYGLLATRTEHPILKQLLARIVKDERRHFAFYFNKALLHLHSSAAQSLTGVILRRWWTPVGDGVKTSAEVRWVTQFLFAGPAGLDAAHRIDGAISDLPGLAWFDLFTRWRGRAIEHSEHESALFSSSRLCRS